MSLRAEETGTGAAQEATEDFDLAKALARIEDLRKVFGAGARDQRRRDAGDFLFQLLTPGAVGELWQQTRASGTGSEPLRISIEIAVEDLRSLPWELLRDRETLLFHHPKLLFSRLHSPGRNDPDSVGDQAPRAELGPLRVLVVVCNPDDWQTLADHEIARVGAALGTKPGRAHLQVLDGPSPEKLFDEVRTWRPHILHFIGHGMPAVPGAPARLPFNWGTGPTQPPDSLQQWFLTSDHVMELLDEWRPRLIVLNACRTTDDPVDRLGGLAHAFLEADVSAVVSMQADIDSPVSVVFAGELYQVLSQGGAVDQAVHAARRKLRLAHADKGWWALPVLVTRHRPESALAIHPKPREEDITKLCEHSLYSELDLFVDRTDERRTAWRALGVTEQPSARPLLVVSGHSKGGFKHTGKTWLTRSCLLSCFVRGYRITYVDLGNRFSADEAAEPGSQHKDWLDLLRAIRGACMDSSQPEPLPAEAFSRFNATLNAMVEGSAPVTATAPGPVADRWEPFDEQVGQADQRREHIFRAFLDGLHAASPDRVHVLALDHAELLLPAPCRQIVYPEFIAPIARNEESPLRLVLVATEEWIFSALPEEGNRMWNPLLRLGDFNQREFMRLAEEYCERAGLDFSRTRQIFEGFRSRENVDVELFGDIRNILVKGTAGRT
ncbi:CHAT domain-containing protein [Streptomyces sp. NPDC093094]|uniref:CHAT domain-containing protein n=1 Tax=Streptomyces sp. NPDC093094 TaxID=3366026 RepID=UPI0038217FB8